SKAVHWKFAAARSFARTESAKRPTTAPAKQLSLVISNGHAEAAEELNRNCPGAGGQALGIPRRGEARSAPSRPAPARRGPPPSHAHLWLVHRRLRNARSD